jgi:hypothetical protein
MRRQGFPAPIEQRRIDMARILAAITRAISLDEYREPRVHFHAADQRPEVCYDAGCTRPRLQVD